MTSGGREPDLVVTEDRGLVRFITLNRPDRRNAINIELSRQLCEALSAFESTDEVHAAVLTGAGPAFCAGLDLGEAAALGQSFFASLREIDAINMAAKVSKPLIAAVNGPAITGGFELALNCDFIIASDKAAFADTHARMGVLPGGGLTVRLPQRVGLASAKALSFTGRMIDGPEAERRGLVYELTTPATLLEDAYRHAAAMAESDPSALQAIKRMYDSGSELTAGGALAAETEASVQWTIDTAGIGDRRDAVTARNRRQLAAGRS